VNILSNDSHLNMYKRSKKMFDIQQMYALKNLYAWRDKLARELDESPGYDKITCKIIRHFPVIYIFFSDTFYQIICCLRYQKCYPKNHLVSLLVVRQCPHWSDNVSTKSIISLKMLGNKLLKM